MNSVQPKMEKIPFAEAKASSAFMAEAQGLLVKEMMNRSGEMVSGSNTQTFCHGRDWIYQREDSEGFTKQTGHLQHHQQQVTLSIDRLLANDMWALPELILGFSEKAASGMAEKFEEELAAVAEEVGNSTAVPQDKSMIDAFIEAFDKGLWSINSNGVLCTPRILPDEKSQQRFQDELATRGEEFKTRFEELRAKKEPIARKAEADRLKKYD